MGGWHGAPQPMPSTPPRSQALGRRLCANLWAASPRSFPALPRAPPAAGLSRGVQAARHEASRFDDAPRGLGTPGRLTPGLRAAKLAEHRAPGSEVVAQSGSSRRNDGTEGCSCGHLRPTASGSQLASWATPSSTRGTVASGELPSGVTLHLGDSRPGEELALGSGAPPASRRASLSPGVLNSPWGAVGAGLLHEAGGVRALLSGLRRHCPMPHSAADPTGPSQDLAPSQAARGQCLLPSSPRSWGPQHPSPQPRSQGLSLASRPHLSTRFPASEAGAAVCGIPR